MTLTALIEIRRVFSRQRFPPASSVVISGYKSTMKSEFLFTPAASNYTDQSGSENSTRRRASELSRRWKYVDAEKFVADRTRYLEQFPATKARHIVFPSSRRNPNGWRATNDNLHPAIIFIPATVLFPLTRCVLPYRGTVFVIETFGCSLRSSIIV